MFIITATIIILMTYNQGENFLFFSQKASYILNRITASITPVSISARLKIVIL